MMCVCSEGNALFHINLFLHVSFLKIHPFFREQFAEMCVTNALHKLNCCRSVFQHGGQIHVLGLSHYANTPMQYYTIIDYGVIGRDVIST